MEVQSPAPHVLTGLTLAELTSLLGSRTRALETLKWLYAQPPLSRELPASVPGVSSRAWGKLRERLALPDVDVVEKGVSQDGTTKYLLRLKDVSVETVLIPAKGRSTVCVSSQSGCTRTCAFCATAKLGFKRNLTAAEMLAQYRVARADAVPGAPARNVVFMGMGEPMDNLDEVLKAVELLTQQPVPMLGARQVTVSTSGVLPGMKRFLAECKASLALSLNASTDEQRLKVMPQTRTWPIEALMELLREDKLKEPRRSHFIEYVMFDGLNDAPGDADRLRALLEGVNARVNLIPHNPIRGSELRPPPEARILEFQKRVVGHGLMCLIRWPRGREVAAACGQLAATELSEALPE
ncbi:MAG: 23S rRNA (adenine(2503)-C(2))-methyltransferase RlmN [Deltaproteobacteria bacterium]|nr:23S rRNA (adenine(2503)-C(2))-methyltransferase RlmN [Deltaproteobacteria bacterium]